MSDPAIRRAQLMEAIEAELPEAYRLRRELHENPDRSGQESATRDRLLAALPEGGSVEFTADTGAVVRFGGEGPAVGLRAELDALAVEEDSGRPWTSRVPGTMHACGHDVNMAALVAVTRAVAGIGVPTPLASVLQPREETSDSGAYDILRSGALERADVASITSAHLQPLLPAGSVACTPGVVNASADEFVVTVTGTSGHAAYPHLVDDTVVAMAHVILALQSLVSRHVDPLTPAVVSIGSLHGGQNANVLPGRMTATGTLRSMSLEQHDKLARAVTEISVATARAHGCEASVEVSTGLPVLRNDAALTGRVAAQLADTGLVVVDDLRTMGADDFSHFCDHLPSLMLFVGVDGGGAVLHSERFAPGDDAVRHSALALGSAYLGAAGD